MQPILSPFDFQFLTDPSRLGMLHEFEASVLPFGVVDSGGGYGFGVSSLYGALGGSGSWMDRPKLDLNVSTGCGRLVMKGWDVEAFGVGLNLGSVYEPGSGWTLTAERRIEVSGDVLKLGVFGETVSYAPVSGKTGVFRATGVFLEGDSEIAVLPSGGYQLKFLTSGEVSTFDGRGREVSRFNRDGMGWSFAYDDSGRLSCLEGGGQRVSYVYQPEKVTVWVRGSSTGSDEMLYEYNYANGVLSNWAVKRSAYQVTYGYDAGRLVSYQAANGLSASWTWSADRVTSYRDGAGYGWSVKQDGAKTSYVNDRGDEVTVTCDPQGRLMGWRYPTGLGEEVGVDVVYDASGRLSSLVTTEGIRHDWAYDTLGGVSEWRRGDRVSGWVRDDEGRLVSSSVGSGVELRRGYVVYEDPGSGGQVLGGQVFPLLPSSGATTSGLDSRRVTHSILSSDAAQAQLSSGVYTAVHEQRDQLGTKSGLDRRRVYTVEPTGMVTLWTPDARGLFVERRVFRDLIDPSLLSLETLTFAVLEDYVAKVGVAGSRLDGADYDEAGRCAKRISYLNQDSSGVGIVDESARESGWEYEQFGLVKALTVKQSSSVSSSRSWQHDPVGRLTQETAPDGGVTSVSYGVLTVTTQTPLGLTRVEEKDAGGRLLKQTERATSGEGEARVRTYGYDRGGYVSWMLLGVLRETYLSDLWNRAVVSGDASGRLRVMYYEVRGRVCQQRVLANRYTGVLDAGLLWGQVSLLFDADRDSVETSIWACSGDLHARVDAEGFVTQYGYNTAGDAVEETAFATAVVPSRVAWRGGQIEVTPDPTRDRVHRTTHNGNGDPVRRLSITGAMTTWDRNTFSEVVVLTRYHQFQPVDAFWHLEDRLVDPVHDQVERYYRDGVGRVALEVDGVGSARSRVFSADDQCVEEIAFADLVVIPNDGSWPVLPNLPMDGSGEDRVHRIKRIYDTMNRCVCLTDSRGFEERSTYLPGSSLRLSLVRHALRGSDPDRVEEWKWSPWAELLGYHSPLSVAQGKPMELKKYAVEGWCLEVMDSEGQRSVYYYWPDGRLGFWVNAAGGLVSEEYDVEWMGQVIERRYATFWPSEELGGLTGGLLTPALWSQLLGMRTLQDRVVQTRRDRVGRVCQITAADGLLTEQAYNVFSEVTLHRMELVKGVFREDASDWDRDGNEVGRVLDQTGLKIGIGSGFDGTGLKQSETTSVGTTSWEYNAARGLVQTRWPDGATQSQAQDGLKRLMSQTDGAGAVSQWSYRLTQGEVSVKSGAGRVRQTIRNAFSEWVKKSILDAAGGNAGSRGVDRNEAGLVCRSVDPVGRIGSHSYNALSWHLASVSPSGLSLCWRHDPVGGVKEQETLPRAMMSLAAGMGSERGVGDPPSPVGFLVNYSRNPFGQLVLETNARGVKTGYGYSLRGDLASTVRAQETLALETQWEKTASGSVLNQVEQDSQTPKARERVWERDALDRAVSLTVRIASGDSVQTGYRYRGQSQAPIVEVDGVGGVTRWIRDAMDRPLAKINAAGEVSAWSYDGAGRVIAMKAYAKRLSASVLSSLTDETDWPALLAVLVSSADDRVSYTLRDGEGLVIGEVSPAGRMTMRSYDAASRLVRERRLASFLSVSSVMDVSIWPVQASMLGAVLTAMEGLRKDELDAETVWIRDAAGQVRYQVDSEGAVTGYEYHLSGQVCRTVRYGSAIASPVSTTDLAVFESTLKPDAGLTDRETQVFYDGFDQARVEVDPEGFVKESQYNEVGSKVGEIRYAKPISPWPQAGLTLLSVLSLLERDPDRDTVVKIAVDELERQVAVMDGSGAGERYSWNALSQGVTVTDALGSVWQKQYAVTGGLALEIAPSMMVTQVLKGAAPLLGSSGSEGDWVVSEAQASLTTTYETDPRGCVLVETIGKGSGFDRVKRHGYDAVSRCVETTVPGVSVVDPSVFPVWPLPGERVVDLTSRVVFDAFGSVVVKVDPSGVAQFWVYDADGLLRYEVDGLGFVTEHRYNGLGFKELVYRYANPIVFDESLYLETGLSLAIVGQLVVRSEEDRFVAQSFDRRGQVLQAEQAPVLVMVPQEGEGSSLRLVRFSPRQSYAYNPFGDIVFEAHWDKDPDALSLGLGSSLRLKGLEKGGSWRSALDCRVTQLAYDRRGLKVWQADPLGYVTTFGWDHGSRLVRRMEYATALTAPEVGVLPPVSVFDRSSRNEYDARGRLIAEVKEGVVAQTVSGTGSDLVLVNQPSQEARKVYTWDLKGRCVAIRDEQGGVKYRYYDAADRLVGETEVSRPEIQSDGRVQLICPIRVSGLNLFGEAVRQRQMSNALSADVNGYTLDPSAMVRESLLIRDSLGLVSEEQGTLGQRVQSSYDLLSSLSRQVERLTGWQGEGALMTKAPYSVIRSWQRDRVGQVTVLITQDQAGQMLDTLYREFNGFREKVGQGLVPLSQRGTASDLGSERWDYNAAGWLVRTNEKTGVWEIRLPNGQGETVRVYRSKTLDLSHWPLTLEGLGALLSHSPRDRLEEERILDQKGRVRIQRHPAYRPGQPEALWTTIRVSEPDVTGKVTVSLPSCQNAFWRPRLWIWPLEGAGSNLSLPQFEALESERLLGLSRTANRAGSVSRAAASSGLSLGGAGEGAGEEDHRIQKLEGLAGWATYRRLLEEESQCRQALQKALGQVVGLPLAYEEAVSYLSQHREVLAVEEAKEAWEEVYDWRLAVAKDLLRELGMKELDVGLRWLETVAMRAKVGRQAVMGRVAQPEPLWEEVPLQLVDVSQAQSRYSGVAGQQSSGLKGAAPLLGSSGSEGVGGRWVGDLSQFATDQYGYLLAYYFQDPQTSRLEPHPRTQTRGNLTVVTTHPGPNQRVLCRQTGPSEFEFAGRTGDLKGFRVLSGSTEVGWVSVNHTIDVNRVTVDLQDYPTGSYRLEPVFGENQLGDPVSMDNNPDIEWSQFKLVQVLPEHGKLLPNVSSPVIHWSGVPRAWQGSGLMLNMTVVHPFNLGESLKTHEFGYSVQAASGQVTIQAPYPAFRIVSGALVRPDVTDARVTRLGMTDEGIIAPRVYVRPSVKDRVDAVVVIQKGVELGRRQLHPFTENGWYWFDGSDLPTSGCQLAWIGLPKAALDSALACEVKAVSLPVTVKLGPSKRITTEFISLTPTVYMGFESYKVEGHHRHATSYQVFLYWQINAPYESASLKVDLVTEGLGNQHCTGVVGPYGQHHLEAKDVTLPTDKGVGNLVSTYTVFYKGETHLDRVTSLSASVLLGDGREVPLPTLPMPSQQTGLKSAFKFDYTPLKVVYLSGLPSSVAKIELDYYHVSMAMWLPLNNEVTMVPGGAVISVASLGTSKFNYRFKAYDSNGVLVDLTDLIQLDPAGYGIGEFVVGDLSNDEVTTMYQEPEVLVRPEEQFKYDRWDNPVVLQNAQGRIRTRDYNQGDQVLRETTELVPWLDETGVWHQTALVTTRGYNVLNTCIGESNANGVVSAFDRDPASQVVMIRRGGVSQVKGYNGFGDLVMQGYPGHETKWGVDLAGRVVSQTDASGWMTGFEHDEVSNLITKWDGLKRETRLLYDARRTLSQMVLPDGSLRRYDRDRGNRLLREVRADGLSQSWLRSTWGQVLKSVDLGGMETTYEWDGLWHVTRERNARSVLSHLHDEAGYLAWTVDNQNQTTQRYHDLGGEPIGERFIAPTDESESDWVRQDVRVVRDPVTGWPLRLEDSRVVANWGYSRVGNRVWVEAYYAEEGSTEVDHYTSWNTFNDRNQRLIAQGMLLNGRIQIGPNQGSELTYDAVRGFRQTERRLDATGAAMTTTLGFLANGTLERVSRSDGKSQVYQTDASGFRRNASYQVAGSVSTMRAMGMWLGMSSAPTMTETYSRSQEPTALGQVGTEAVRYDKHKQRYDNSTTTYRLTAEGDVTNQRTDWGGKDGDTIHDELERVYQNEEKRLLTQVTGVRTEKHADPVTTKPVEVTYDPRENPILVTGSTSDGPRYLQWNHDGKVLHRNTVSGSRTYWFYAPQGSGLGLVGQVTRDTAGKIKLDFDLGYHPISDDWFPTAPSSVVSDGVSSYSDYALECYGDAAFGDVLALANGASSPEDVAVEGVTITVPVLSEVMGEGQLPDSLQPSLNSLLGSLYPQMAMPKVHHPHVGFWVKFLQVAEVVALSLLPLLLMGAAPVGAMTLSWLSRLVLLEAIGGSLGNLLSQETGVVGGAQGSVNWSGVWSAGLTAMEGALVGAGLSTSALSGLLDHIGSWVSGAAKGAMSNLGVQGLSVLTHQQQGVSWQSMVQSVVSDAALSHSVLPSNPIAAEVFKQGEQVVASVMVGQALSRQKLDPSTVAANVFGSMVGGAAAGKAAEAWDRFRYSRVAGSGSLPSSSPVAGPSSHSLVAGSGGVIHPAVEHSPLSHSATGTPVQSNWTGDDWRDDAEHDNHYPVWVSPTRSSTGSGQGLSSMRMGFWREASRERVGRETGFSEEFRNKLRNPVEWLTSAASQYAEKAEKAIPGMESRVLRLEGQLHHARLALGSDALVQAKATIEAAEHKIQILKNRIRLFDVASKARFAPYVVQGAESAVEIKSATSIQARHRAEIGAAGAMAGVGTAQAFMFGLEGVSLGIATPVVIATDVVLTASLSTLFKSVAQSGYDFVDDVERKYHV